jgi:hypothetical protein
MTYDSFIWPFFKAEYIKDVNFIMKIFYFYAIVSKNDF